MSTSMSNELASFHDFVGEKLRAGGTPLSPEQVLAQWKERVETIASVERGLDDVEAGRTRPAQEVIDELRNEP
jgi:predicted transcriptional regulator